MEIAAHFLDVAPYPWERQEAERLHRTLASAYPKQDGIEQLLKLVGIKTEEVKFADSGFDTWKNVLDEASSRGLLRALVRRVLQNPRKAAFRQSLEQLLEAPVRPDRYAIIDLLTSAYSEPAQAEGLLVAARVALEPVDWNRPIRDAWGSIIDRAHAAGLLHDLLNQVLEDPSVAGYHQPLRRLLLLRGLTRTELARIAQALGREESRRDELERLARETELPLHHVYWDQAPIYVWRELLELARARNKLFDLLQRVTKGRAHVEKEPLIAELIKANKGLESDSTNDLE